MTEFSKLPSEVKDAAVRGLRDPEDSGAPYSLDEVLSDYKSGLEVRRNLGNTATFVIRPATISQRAATAPDADEHSKLGPYPTDPSYIR